MTKRAVSFIMDTILCVSAIKRIKRGYTNTAETSILVGYTENVKCNNEKRKAGKSI